MSLALTNSIIYNIRLVLVIIIILFITETYFCLEKETCCGSACGTLLSRLNLNNLINKNK